jgi:outer membrane receptor protein involved in Fe transport
MTNSKAAFRAALMVAAVVHASMAPPAAAQASAATAYQLPAEDLGDALRSIARQSGREILFEDLAVQGRRAPVVDGRFTPEEAVGAAISGSGLIVEQRAGALVVRTGPIAGADRDSHGDAEITVTGTRIRGTDGPSPVVLTTRTALEDAGITDLAGFSRALPQNYAGGQNPGVAGSSDQGGQSNVNNSTTLNLRGLGADATLTLINGHRLAYDALLQGIDISAIPLAAIERVEVIADGASALYGSDAVAGVVNILLRRDYDGVQASARAAAATDGGNVQQQYTIVSGTRWGSGGFMLAGDFSKNTPVLAADRSYTRRLNGAQTLIAEGRQASAILAGHQRLADGIAFEFDAQFMDRWMEKVSAFSTADPRVRGQINRPSVRSWAITPSLRLDIAAGWTASLEATRSVSETLLRTRVFSNRVETPGRARYENRLTNFEASAEGPLFRLPGGDVRLAAGGGHRAFALDIDTRQTVAGVTRVTRDATEERQSLFAYGELSVPLIGRDNRLPLLEALRLSAAVRYERYAGIDEVATPKLGLVYDPHPDIRLKFSWGRSFKIPTLNQVNQLPSGGLLPGTLFAPQPVPPLATNASVLALSGGNPDLRAERATAWSATLELKPNFAPGLALQASWFDVDYRDRIAVPITDTLSVLANPAFADFVVLNPTVAQVNAIVAALPQALTNATTRPYNPAEVGAIIDARLRNTARERVRGLDLAGQYRFDLGVSRVLLSAAASYLHATRKVREGLPAIERSGILFAPAHWRGRVGGSWENGQVQLAAHLNYVGGVRDNRLAFLTDIQAFTTLDLSARVRTTTASGPLRALEFRLSALNQLNARPDIIGTSDPSAIPFDSTNQSSVGRFVSFSVTKSW